MGHHVSMCLNSSLLSKHTARGSYFQKYTALRSHSSRRKDIWLEMCSVTVHVSAGSLYRLALNRIRVVWVFFFFLFFFAAENATIKLELQKPICSDGVAEMRLGLSPLYAAEKKHRLLAIHHLSLPRFPSN